MNLFLQNMLALFFAAISCMGGISSSITRVCVCWREIIYICVYRFNSKLLNVWKYIDIGSRCLCFDVFKTFHQTHTHTHLYIYTYLILGLQLYSCCLPRVTTPKANYIIIPSLKYSEHAFESHCPCVSFTVHVIHLKRQQQ